MCVITRKVSSEYHHDEVYSDVPSRRCGGLTSPLGMVRFKRRYLVVEVVPEGTGRVRMSSLQEAVLQAVKRLHGDFGVGAITAGFGVKYLNPETGAAFISCGRGPHRLVSSALPFITQVGGKTATVCSLHHAASMRHGFIFLKKYNEEKLKELEQKLPTEERERWQQEKYKSLGRS